MNIAFDHQIFSSQRYGGISRYYYELARGLAEVESAKLNVFVNSPLYINRYLPFKESSAKLLGFQVPEFRGSWKMYHMLNSAISPLFMRGFCPDIVHETYYSNRVALSRTGRVVVTVYDMIHELFPQSFLARDNTSILKRDVVNRADHVICISEHTRQDLVRLFDVPIEKTSVVHLGFSLTNDSLAKCDSGIKPYLLYVGARGGYKNFAGLLKAYASSSWLRSNFDLVAFGGRAFSHEEQNLIRSLGLDVGKVRQLDGDDSVLAACYSQAALFVYPSMYEGFGIPPLEAMSYGCPVACSNSSSIPEVVGNAATLFDPASIESMVSVICRVLQDSSEWENLRVLGRARINNFSWSKCALETYSVYQKVLS